MSLCELVRLEQSNFCKERMVVVGKNKITKLISVSQKININTFSGNKS